MTPITPVILSGGSGTRLWPLSTPAQPKQFHALVGHATMFAQTLDRVADRARFAAPVIVCGEGHVAHVRADLDRLGITDATIIVEPMARNTAPAIALAAHALPADAMMLVMPSDHAIADPDAFLAAVKRARPAVDAGALATFGITADHPHTGYGYIASGPETAPGSGVHRVLRFVEKPDLARAERMVTEGGYLWNAGIFLMRADAYRAALEMHAPAVAQASREAMQRATRGDGLIRPEEGAFGASPSISVDYAVLERSDAVVTLPVTAGWSDLGSWAAIHALAGKDSAGNAAQGAAIAIESSGNLLHAAEGMRVSMLGVHDLVVVATPTEVLVMPRARAEEVKALAERGGG